MTTRLLRSAPIWGAFAALATIPATAADSQPAPTVTHFTYADLADLAVGTPVAAHVRIDRAVALDPERAAGALPGTTRFYVEAEVIALIRGANGLASKISYLADIPNDARGRPARVKRKTEYLVLGRAVPGRAGEFRLAAPDAQIPYSPEQADTLRAILREATAADAAPAITGIGRAFHVPGSLPGESETQIFLQTADGDPVSLSVLRRPGETPRWAVALTEIVDDTAAPPEPNSLLWYRLACTLPAALPAASFADADSAAAAAIRADYALILDGLGSCARARGAG